MTWPTDGERSRWTFDRTADSDSRADVPLVSAFDPQTAATKVHEGNFGAVDQELCLVLISV